MNWCYWGWRVMIYLGVALKTDEVITVVAKPIVLKT